MKESVHAQRILVLDFGSQYSQLVARRVREIGVYCEIYPYDLSDDFIRSFAPSGIILTGGPESVTQSSTPRAPAIVFSLGCPVLGICYGMQTMAEQLGGKVTTGEQREFGYAELKVSPQAQLLSGLRDKTNKNNDAVLDVWMSHGDHVAAMPSGFSISASTSSVHIAAMQDLERRFYGMLFHPEVTHTKFGKEILKRFVCDICECQPLWTAQNILTDLVEGIRQQVGSDKVLLGLSGGTDSSVLAALLHKAIGKQLVCVFVDTGLLRSTDGGDFIKGFAQNIGLELHIVHAAAEFYQALQGIHDPEQKRKLIGKLFIDIFEREAKKISGLSWLAQGTIYSDVIESAGTKDNKGHLIKSHHNVGGLPEKMMLRLLEPLRELFKDEVIQIGLSLGLPKTLLYAHPFPGPGLAVRILGEVKLEYIELLRKADHIFIEELKAQDLYFKVKQAFAVFLPVKSVGVVGDARQYAYVIALRAVETIDFMTAHWAELPAAFLAKVSNRIINEVPGISRVVYDISGKPPATIEWE